MRNPATYFILVAAACAVLTAGCGSSLLGSLYKQPTPMPSPVISTVPTSLSFSSSSLGPTTLTASESNGNSYFTATTSDATIATVAVQQGSTNVFVVTATGKSGNCNIQITDGAGNSDNVPVTTH